MDALEWSPLSLSISYSTLTPVPTATTGVVGIQAYLSASLAKLASSQTMPDLTFPAYQSRSKGFQAPTPREWISTRKSAGNIVIWRSVQSQEVVGSLKCELRFLKRGQNF